MSRRASPLSPAYSGTSVQALPSGLISVMPQAWTTFTPIVVLKCLRHGARTGRAADHDALEIGELAAGLLQMLQQHQPDGRNAGRAGHLVGVEQLVDRGAVELG